MLVKLEAIVLHSFPYGDNSSIVKCFTDNLGLQTYLVNGVKNKKGVLKPSMIFPLTHLQLVAYHKNKGTLERIKEAKLASTYKSLHLHPVKNAMTLFIAEVLLKVIKEEQANKELFNFVVNRLQELDLGMVSLKDFHLRFLLDLSLYMGFRPTVHSKDVLYFDMQEGQFTNQSPTHPYYTSQEETQLLVDLLENKDSGANRKIRLELLNSLLSYYRLHIDSFGQLKSLEVLKELF